MRRSANFCLALLAMGYAASAQFSITPRFGMEGANTKIQYNDLSSFSPLCSFTSPQAALRMDYRFKKMHGIYLGAATNRSVIAYQFADPETGMTEYQANKGDYRIRLDAGYQFSFKPIKLGNSKTAAKSANKAPSSEVKSQPAKQGCARVCGSKSYYASRAKPQQTYMRIQPFAGYSFVPGTQSNLSQKTVNGTTGFEYLAGNWRQAISTGVDFEFGKGKRRIMVIGIQYLKGLDNMNAVTAEMAAGNKTSTATLRSSSSSWSLNAGIPIVLGKKQTSYNKTVIRKVEVTETKAKTVTNQPKKSYYYNKCGSKN